MKGKINNGAEYKTALIKKALGYDATEVVEEYVSDENGDVKLTKKKVTKKNVPPDITAIKLLLGEQTPLQEMSDEELLAERERLIGLLKSAGEN
jgi:hypothetical protein